MDKENQIFLNFVRSQRKYIDDAKYFEGLKINNDPGDQYILAWIKDHAEEFRKRWNESKCKNCSNADICGNNLILEINICKNFNEL